jgi:hypothetical protein
MVEFEYYFAQREALETIIYLYDVAGVQDKHDMMRFDGSGLVSRPRRCMSVRRSKPPLVSHGGSLPHPREQAWRELSFGIPPTFQDF